MFNTKAQNNFTKPLYEFKYLSGNFGELRPNHFHTGIDIKTNGQINKKIFSIDDGYVSRINISLWGYGKAIYITHPNGYTSVYAHINKFNPEIETYIKSLQYKEHTYTLDILISKNIINVKKGEFIAYSGNTGNSFGPHLHFEIRKTKSEHPINPLIFYKSYFTDTKPPVISKIVIFNLSNYPIQQKSYNYNEISNDTILTSTICGAGIKVYDYMNYTTNKYAPYKIKLYKNEKLIFEFIPDEFDFSENRFVNAHINYEEYIENKTFEHKLFVEPNDTFSLYKTLVNKGIISLSTNEVAKIKIEAEDIYGNKSNIRFWIKSDNKIPEKIKHTILYLSYKNENIFSNDTLKIIIPKNALYDNIDFSYKNLGRNKYRIGNIKTPLHKDITLKIKNLNIKDTNKIIIVRISKNGRLQALPSTCEDDYIVAKSNCFGTFKLMQDTIKPKIKPINIYENAKYIKGNKIQFKITDNLSGIKTYSGFIDDKWVLFQYDPKKSLITYFFDEICPATKQNHTLKLFITDAIGNKAFYKVNFFY